MVYTYFHISISIKKLDKVLEAAKTTLKAVEAEDCHWGFSVCQSEILNYYETGILLCMWIWNFIFLLDFMDVITQKNHPKTE